MAQGEPRSAQRAHEERKREVTMDRAELREWMASLDEVAGRLGREALGELLSRLDGRAREHGAPIRRAAVTPYVNTIGLDDQPPYPGSLEIERRLRNLVRYNAMALVVRANREHDGIGGHISTYASAATLWEVAFHHFLRATDLVYFQGHASPGIYARAFLEGRLSEDELRRFRRETGAERGLSSYPHPWLMPDLWQFPTVSMGLSPLMAIYQARFNRYLAQRGLVDTGDQRVWCFMGDGECDEPESTAGISLAAREKLDNLILVVNCNLQRLDGPVRGNGKIIQELEALFGGAGWNVVKVLWGSDWDPLLARDDGLLVERMTETLDGEYQKYVVAPGSYIRKHFFGVDERLAGLVAHLSDEQLQKLGRGGHDPRKVYAAFDLAMQRNGRPTVVLAKTIKGYGLGEGGEGRNVTHQQKKLNHEELLEFRARFGVPISDDEIDETPFYKPTDDSPEIRYLKKRREKLGGFLPQRKVEAPPLEVPALELFQELCEGSGDRAVSTTMAYVRMLTKLLRHDTVGERIVPIIPDEARTFGMETLFRRHGIYAAEGQKYEPVDESTLLPYREARDGQILEEGITEAGSLSSFIAAGTAYASHALEMIPFFTFYSMFGFQRVGDLLWAAADARAKGFLVGATAGRTTLSGEGLQHQDGHSHIAASTVPNLHAYDPAYAYELAVIVQDGMRRMYTEGEVCLYYLTLYNEPYPMPAMPDGSAEGIVAGMHPLSTASEPDVELLASGPLVREALRAQEILESDFEVTSRVWSVTSYLALRRDALRVERRRRLGVAEEGETTYLERALDGARGPFVAVSDYMRLSPEQIARFLPGPVTVLGTDGFGRSDTREALRRHFEIDAEHIAHAALSALFADKPEELRRARDALGIDPHAPDPAYA
jgi:pyruvate dehydrogenase E1 component